MTSATGSTFTYADPVTAGPVVNTFSATDVFFVDGAAASEAVFVANLSPGDLVTILANTPTTGVTTYKLVNKLPADYVSGLVGPVNTGATVYSVIEPITGTVVSAASINYSGTYTIYTLNGAASTLAAISLAINEGDTIVSTGTGADATHLRTIALTNTTVAGTVSTPSVVSAGVSEGFFIDTAAGATLGDNPAVGADTAGYVVTAADTFTLDGAADTFANFVAQVSAGDTATYSRAAGVQTVALTNKAPLAIHGQITASSVSTNTFTYVPDGGGVTTVGSLPAGIVLTVDGVLATAAEFDAAFTLGDTVVYRAADATTSTTASLKLTNANFSGTVTDGTGTIHTVIATSQTDTAARIGVFAAGSTTVRLGQVNYATNDGTGLTGTPVYKVNGVVKTLTQFNTSLTGIVNGSLTGTILVSQVGTTVVYALATAIA